MVKRKKSLKTIQKEIKQQKLKITRAKALAAAEQERVNAERELKLLKRSTSTSRNIRLAKRTGRGLKIIGKKGLKLAKIQLKRIEEQQRRDRAIERLREKRRRKAAKGIKRIKKGARKVRSQLPSQILADLDF